MEEEIRLVVHEDSITGPFPDNFVLADLGKGARRGCVHEGFCQLYCVGHGNNLDTLHVSKVTGAIVMATVFMTTTTTTTTMTMMMMMMIMMMKTSTLMLLHTNTQFSGV